MCRLGGIRVFQSHIGAIRMGKVVLGSVVEVYFNPTLVQLESISTTSLLVSLLYFNPTLVQLESRTTARPDGLRALFQSHIGAIRIVILLSLV